MDQNLVRTQAQRLMAIRTDLLRRYPFFGRLLLRLPFGFSDCETAYTDMEKVVFDPEFSQRIGDSELEFVLLHELMHCVLKHCTRGSGKLHIVYNIACDIVVNSILLDALNLNNINIDGCDAMHLAPNGKEGRRYSAEEVYAMLMENYDSETGCLMLNTGFDNHSVWGKVEVGVWEATWDKNTSDAVKQAGTGSGIPASIKRLVEENDRAPKISWQHILQDFIRHDRADFDFNPPDRRFQNDFFLPDFHQFVDGTRIENLWFVIDTSASVSGIAIGEAFSEIKDAIRQIDTLEGKISFFDTEVTEPIQFETIEDVNLIRPIGGGGTSFKVIFKKMPEYFEEELPTAVIIITDGYADFPKETAALGVPVIWLMVDSEVKVPWGESVYIKTN